MTQYRYRVVDVFTERALEGNALAVFPDAAGLDDEKMQSIARETNLPETTFVVPSTRADCVARVRIFTPRKEMPFAGHPTIGTAFVLRDQGHIPATQHQFALEGGVGPVSVYVDSTATGRSLLWLRTPNIEWGPVYDRGLATRALGLSTDDLLDLAPQRLSAGNPTLFVAVKSREVVDAVEVKTQEFAALKHGTDVPFCVFVFCATSEGAYSRMFAPDYGIVEDPATGSSTGPLAGYMMRHGLLPEGVRAFQSEQGTKMRRRSILHVRIDGNGRGERIDVGGHVTPVGSGQFVL